MSKPFLRWVGGKQRLVKTLLPLFPKHYTQYIEPFAGGGAMFYAQPLRGRSAFLSDANRDLMAAYKAVQRDPNAVIDQARDWGWSEDSYYEVRSLMPANDMERGARLIYLVKRGFNGLWRVNSRGRNNVPFGKFSDAEPAWCRSSLLFDAAEALSDVGLVSADFRFLSATLDLCVGPSTMVFFDPPYPSVESKNKSLKYTSRNFTWKDQIFLGQWFGDLSDRGCYVIETNADTPAIREIYAKHTILEVKERRSVSTYNTDLRRASCLIILSTALSQYLGLSLRTTYSMTDHLRASC